MVSIKGKSVVRRQFECPYCETWIDAVEEYDDFNPEERLAATADCKPCDIRMIRAYGPVFIYAGSNPIGTAYPVRTRHVATRIVEA